MSASNYGGGPAFPRPEEISPADAERIEFRQVLDSLSGKALLATPSPVVEHSTVIERVDDRAFRGYDVTCKGCDWSVLRGTWDGAWDAAFDHENHPGEVG